MTEKCIICGEKIEETFLGKPNGTILMIKDKEGKKIKYYACKDCQKKHKDKTRDEAVKNR